MKALLTALILLTIAAPAAAFDYGSCVQSGAGTNMERMGAAAWRKAFDLSSRQILCAGDDDRAKAADQRRRIDQQDRAAREWDQQQRAARDSDQRVREEQERLSRNRYRAEPADREMLESGERSQEERAERSSRKTWECARSGLCSTTKDIQEQINRSKREAAQPATGGSGGR